MSWRVPSLVHVAALLFVLCFQGSLVNAWLISPLDKGAWIALLIWITPILLYRCGWLNVPAKVSLDNTSLLMIGIILTVLGIIGSVNSLKTLGLAFALASFVPLHPVAILWLISSLAWMHPFAYLGSYYLGPYIFSSRLLFVTPCTACFVWCMSKTKEETADEIS